MANQTSVASVEHQGAIRRVSWGAIFAGTIVALVVQIVLTLLGLSIGLGVMSQAPGTVAPEAAETVKRKPQQARQTARQALQQAQQLRQEAERMLNQAQQQATQTARQAAPVASGAALGGFVALVLSAIAAALGGVTGAPRNQTTMATRQ